MKDLDDLFEAEAQRQRKEAEREDRDPAYQAFRAAKRASEHAKLSRPGVVQEDPEPDFDDEGEGPDEEDQ